MSRFWSAAFLADMATYLTMTGVPYLALRLGAGPVLLGLLPVARSLPYSVTATWAGDRTEKGERLRLARWTLFAAAASVAALSLVDDVAWVYPLLALNGFAMAFFWPSLQATLADVSPTGRARNLGLFNVAWSSGKTLGFLLGGLALAALGFRGLFLAAGVGFLTVAGLVTSRPRPAPDLSPPEPIRPDPGSAGGPTTRLRLAAWIGNAAAYGMGAVLNVHYPQWLEKAGRGETLFGTYLGLVFGAQTVAFLVLTRWGGWHHRRAPILLAQVPLIAVLLLLPRIESPAGILATAPFIGLGLGTAYFASLFYSVESSVRRGRNAGIHEALLGIGSMALPVLGGWAAGASGRLDAPYVVSAGVGVGVVVAQGLLLSPAGKAKRPETGARAIKPRRRPDEGSKQTGTTR